MRNYEVTFIVDPVLSGDEIEATAQTYVNYLEKVGCHIVHVDKMGLRQLAYEIKRRSSGVYFCVEFSCTSAEFLTEFELNMRRDERLLRFLTVALDKFGVKYNDDKRKGLIGKKRKVADKEVAEPAQTAALALDPVSAASGAIEAEPVAASVEAPVAEPEAGEPLPYTAEDAAEAMLAAEDDTTQN